MSGAQAAMMIAGQALALTRQQQQTGYQTRQQKQAAEAAEEQARRQRAQAAAETAAGKREADSRRARAVDRFMRGQSERRADAAASGLNAPLEPLAGAAADFGQELAGLEKDDKAALERIGSRGALDAGQSLRRARAYRTEADDIATGSQLGAAQSLLNLGARLSRMRF